MPTSLLRSLLGLFLAAILVITYSGGAETSNELAICIALLFSITAVGAAAWTPWQVPAAVILPAESAAPDPCRSSSSQRLRRAFSSAVLLYLLAVVFAVSISPLSGLMLELGLAMAGLPITYFLVRAQLRSGAAWEQIWGVLRMLAVMLALFALGERLLTVDRSYAFTADPNVLAALFNLFLLIEFSALTARWREERTPQANLGKLAILATVAAAHGTTGSLSGLICLLVMLLPLTALAMRGLPWHRSGRVAALAAGILLLSLACSGGTAEPPSTKLQGLPQHSSFTVRVAMAQSSLAIYRDGPWYGSGLGSFRLYYPRYRSTLDSGTTGTLVHNDYVQLLQEGGPQLLAALLLIALLTAVRTTSLIYQSWREGPSASQLRMAGLGAALLALLLHAGMNFIFYVEPLAFLFGVVLAGFAPPPLPAAELQGRRGQSVALPLAVAALGLGLLATLGARSLFLTVTNERCQLHLCNNLGGDAAFMKKLTAYLAGTQPSWMPVREYLVNNNLSTEQAVDDEGQKTLWRHNAFREAVSLLQDVPDSSWPYASVADLLAQDSSLAAGLPPGLPRDADAFYRLAIAHDPLDLRIRLKLSQRLFEKSLTAEAYSVLREVMPHWKLALWGDGGRMQLLVSMIPLAVHLHHCSEAQEMSEGLKVFMQMQQEAASRGVRLPSPPTGLRPPMASEGQKVVALAAICA